MTHQNGDIMNDLVIALLFEPFFGTCGPDLSL